MIPPILIQVRFGWFWIPLPVVLLWPLLAIVWILLGLALSITALSLSLLGEYNQGINLSAMGSIWITTWQLLCSFRGICVDIVQPDIHLKISIT